MHKIANAVLCEVLSIGWHPFVTCAVYRYRNFIEKDMIRLTVLTQDSVYVISANSYNFRITFAYFLNKSQKDFTIA